MTENSPAAVADQIARSFAEPLALLMMGPASLWLSRLEQKILRAGNPLGSDGLLLAKAAGVTSPDRVRVMIAPEIPGATASLARTVGQRSRTVVSNPLALTARYGVLLTPRSADDREVLAHELVHVAQFERMGGAIHTFLGAYIVGCLRDGYWDCNLELEARDTARRIVTPH